jgi:hypothetical protein
LIEAVEQALRAPGEIRDGQSHTHPPLARQEAAAAPDKEASEG